MGGTRPERTNIESPACGWISAVSQLTFGNNRQSECDGNWVADAGFVPGMTHHATLLVPHRCGDEQVSQNSRRSESVPPATARSVASVPADAFRESQRHHTPWIGRYNIAILEMEVADEIRIRFYGCPVHRAPDFPAGMLSERRKKPLRCHRTILQPSKPSRRITMPMRRRR